MDSRAGPQRARLSQQLGHEVTPYSLVPRLLWVAEHEPAVLQQSRWALQSWDFLGYRLAGGTAAVSSTLPGYAVWNREWLAAAGLAESPLIAPAAVAGQAYAETGGRWAEECGLPPGIRVVASMDDGNGSLVGAAGWVKGRATDVGGTAGGLALCWDAPLAAPGVDLWPAIVPGTYTLGGVFAAGGRAVDWWTGVAGGADVPATLALAEQSRAGSDGLLFVPFLAGERSPYWDASARGAFLGLTFSHGPAQLARAVVESSGYSLRLLCEAIVQAGARIEELRLCGTQARSRFWNQVKADVTGYQVQVPRVVNVALMGNAVLGAVGAGLSSDIISAGNAMVRVAETLEPQPAHHTVHDELFGVYRQAYGALKPFFEPLGRAAG
jgi:xylulokinase